MSSEAVNARSFASYISRCCKYIGGAALSSEHQNNIKDFLIQNISNPASLLNIKSACNMINKLRSKLELSTISVINNSSALSLNTAINLVSKYLPASDISSFTTFSRYYGTNGMAGLNAGGKYIRVCPTNAGSVSLSYTLVGGGGGGSGSITGDGDKNASYTLQSGDGGKGGDSTIQLNGTTQVTAGGGNGGAHVGPTKVGGNPTLYTYGNSGSDGETKTGAINIPAVGIIRIGIGTGGGGGSGASASAGGTTGSKVWIGGNGANGCTFYDDTSGRGGTGGSAPATACEWSREDGVFAGGGGGGGLLGPRGNNWSSGAQLGSQYSPGTGGESIGGGGGWCNHNTNWSGNGSNDSNMGKGGLRGWCGFETDVIAAAFGGNGGNAGGVKISSSTGANALFFRKLK